MGEKCQGGWRSSRPPGANRGLIQSLDRAWLDAGQGSHFRSWGVIVGISLSTMSTMPEPYPVSAGAWHRLLKNYAGKDGRRALFESISYKTNSSLQNTDPNSNKNMIIHHSSSFTFKFWELSHWSSMLSISLHGTVNNELCQAVLCSTTQGP